MNFTAEARELFVRLAAGPDNYFASNIQSIAAALQSAYERGEQSGREKERERCADIADGNFDNGIRRKIDKCAHDKFNWEDCNACVAEAIRNQP